jgi:hypothetical protein
MGSQKSQRFSKSTFSIFVIVSGLLVAAALSYWYNLQAQDDALRVERAEKRNKVRVEIAPSPSASDFDTRTPHSESIRFALQAKNQAGDFLTTPWHKWLSDISEAVGGDAAIIELRAELPRLSASKNMNDGVIASETIANLQLEVRDDLAFKRLLSKFSDSSTFGTLKVESAMDSGRGVEKFLTVKLSFFLKR